MSPRNHWLLTSAVAAALLFCVVSYGKRIQSLEAQLGVDSSAANSAAVTSTQPADRVPGAIAERVRALELELAHLKQRRAPPHHRSKGLRASASTRHTSSAATATVIDTDDVLEVLDSDDPDVRDRLGEMLRDEMQDQREERRADRIAKRKERAERMVRDLAQEF